jgi:hypothetical protein
VVSNYTFRLIPPRDSHQIADYNARRALLSVTTYCADYHYGKKYGDYPSDEMARLRVPASPVKARHAKFAHATVGNKTPTHAGPRPNTNSALDSDSAECTERYTTPPNAVKSSTLLDRVTKEDVQGYVLGQYEAVEKVGHELINPTDTKAVFILGQTREEEEEVDSFDEDMKADLCAYVDEDEDADRSWCEVRDFMRKATTFNTKASTMVKDSKLVLYTLTTRRDRLMRPRSEPSLAQCIANASSNNAESDTDSDSEDDSVDINQKIDRTITSFARKIGELEDEQETTITIPTNRYIDGPSPSLSPPRDIDIPYPRALKQDSGLRRHSGNRSLAFFMACAENDLHASTSLSSSSLPDGIIQVCAGKRCHDPNFRGHSPCATHDENNCGCSADDALNALRERFRKVQCGGDGTNFDCREWLDAKLELGCSMVHGPSLLRFATNCYEHEKLGRPKDDIVAHADRPGPTGRIRTSPSKDTLNTKSSIRTSVFSKCTSMTSMSSYVASRPQSAQAEHGQLRDTRDLDVDTEKGEHNHGICMATVCNPSVAGVAPQGMRIQCGSDGTMQAEKHTSSLPVLTTKEWSSGVQLWETNSWPNEPGGIGNSIDDARGSVAMNDPENDDVKKLLQLPVSLRTTTENVEDKLPEVVVNDSYDVPLMDDHERAAKSVEHVSTNSDVNSENWSEPFNSCAQQHRKWTSKMKYCLQKIPKKTKQATHGCVKATKRFSRTARGFLPAAVSSRHPFQKIGGII